MDLSAKVLGTTTAAKIRERIEMPVLMLGGDRFTRSDLASVTCFNFHAALNLWKAVTDLGVKNTRDLYDRVAPGALALPRVGSVALAVLGAAFESKGVGGESPLENWMTRHAPEGSKHPIHTFNSIKLAAEKEAKRERQDRKRRKHARRDRAHRLRTGRYLSRQEGAVTVNDQ